MRHPGLAESLLHLGGGEPSDRLLHRTVHLAPGGSPAGIGDEVGPPGQIHESERGAEWRPELVAEHGGDNPTVGRSERPIGNDAVMARSNRSRVEPRSHCRSRRVGEQGEGGIHERDLHVATVTVAQPPGIGRHRPQRRPETGGQVADGHTGSHRHSTLLAGHRHDSALGLGDEVVGGLVLPVRSPCIAGYRYRHQVRVAGGESVRREVEPGGRFRPVVLNHDVGGSQQRIKSAAPRHWSSDQGPLLACRCSVRRSRGNGHR